MGNLVVGLGLWHEDVQRIMDGFAYGRNPSLREHETKRPDELYWPSAVELQVGSLDIFTAQGTKRGPFEYDRFSQKACDEFFNFLDRSNTNSPHAPVTSGMLSDMLPIITTQAAVHRTLEWVRSKPYRGVHSSDAVYDRNQRKVVACDLSDPDIGVHRISMWKYQGLMTLAKVVNATSFVMHPTPVDSCNGEWLGMSCMLEKRRERKSQFFESLKELLTYHKDQGASFPLVIENLEFPKFPATAEECMGFLEHASSLAADIGLPPGIIQVCFDLQHMRHSYKIINEPQNRRQYEARKDIEFLLPGFGNAHRAFAGTSYHEDRQTAIRSDPPDIADLVLSNLGRAIGVVHLAGNYQSQRMDYIDETQGNIPYFSAGKKIAPKSLNVRRAMRMLLKHNLTAPIIIEDQTIGAMISHLESAASVERYIKEEESPMVSPKTIQR